MKTGNVVPTIVKAEHIGPDDTGDNIEAKRVAGYVWNGSTWQRMTQPGGVATGTTSTITQVGDSASSVTLKAANTSRVKVAITNDSSAVLYIKEGATASLTDYSYRLVQYGVAIIDDYNGVVSGIWASDAGGFAYVTETV